MIPKTSCPGALALAPGPETRSADGVLELLARDARGRADVQAHRDVGAEVGLDPRDGLGREAGGRAVVDGAERDALVVRFENRVAQREDLVAAGVGQDRAVPPHEAVQPAGLGDQFVSGAEVQVVGVAEQDRGPRRAHLVRVERLDGRLRPDWHERGRRDLAMGGPEHAGARGAVGRSDREAHRISIASPKE